MGNALASASGNLPGQVIQNRAIRPIVAVAIVGEVLQRAHHRLHLGDLALQVRDVAFSEILDLRGGAAAIAPKGEQGADRLQRKAEGPRALS